MRQLGRLGTPGLFVLRYEARCCFQIGLIGIIDNDLVKASRIENGNALPKFIYISDTTGKKISTGLCKGNQHGRGQAAVRHPLLTDCC